MLFRPSAPAEENPAGRLSEIAREPSPADEAFVQGLRDLGYIEGQNIAIEYRRAAGKVDRLSALADELVQLKVDVIVAAATPAVQAAKNATTTIPIVMVSEAEVSKCNAGG